MLLVFIIEGVFEEVALSKGQNGVKDRTMWVLGKECIRQREQPLRRSSSIKDCVFSGECSPFRNNKWKKKKNKLTPIIDNGFPGGSVVKNLQSVCPCRRHGFHPWVGKIPWRRKWQPTPVLLPGKSHEQRSLAGYSPWGLRVGHD